MRTSPVIGCVATGHDCGTWENNCARMKAGTAFPAVKKDGFATKLTVSILKLSPTVFVSIVVTIVPVTA